jgi:hypothetical protein
MAYRAMQLRRVHSFREVGRWLINLAVLALPLIFKGA